jgi:hypothetical protein
MYLYKTVFGLFCSLLLVVITACGGDTTNTKFGNAGQPTNHSANAQKGTNAANAHRGTNTANVSRGSLFNIHNNTSLVMNQSLAAQIAALTEVKSARVLSTESNVYVAVRLKDRNDLNPSHPSDSSNMISNDHVIHENTIEQTTPLPLSGITGNSYDHGQSLNNNTMTNSDVPTQTKQKIIDKVRSLSNPSLHHVYVSANPDLVHIFENYARDVKKGKPLSGAVDEFNIIVQRIFPTTDGTGAYGGSTSSGKPSVNYTNSGDNYTGGLQRR